MLLDTAGGPKAVDMAEDSWIPPCKQEIWQPEGKGAGDSRHFARILQQTVRYRDWQWPERPVLFFADPHADAEAFRQSLEASGGIVLENGRMRLTPLGEQALFIIGGDFLDKGPSNLQLLRTVQMLRQTGARVLLLAGNHDVRLLVGLLALDQPMNVLSRHLFVRMGPKVIPLFREIFSHYLAGSPLPEDIPDTRACRRLIMPDQDWFDRFPGQAGRLVTSATIHKELRRLREKIDEFETAAEKEGLSLRQVMATAQVCRQLFVEADGEFSWFFNEMQLMHREGSFLFIHAGLDDQVVGLLEMAGIDEANRLYQDQSRNGLFDFYFGPLANTLRTKYRETDYPLTSYGVDRAFRQGIHAVVHGHRNRHRGQRLTARTGLLHFESDITMDRNSRRKEKLSGPGIGVTVIRPEGRVLGISADHDCIKCFEPAFY